MKILCLSDLHLGEQEVNRALEIECPSPLIAKIQGTVAGTNPDVVVVTGDTVSPRQVRLLCAVLKMIVPQDIPVIATLGNHEFWGQTFEGCLDKLKEQTLAVSNVFLLDLLGNVELNGVNFVGGTLFFDGSMRWRESQKITPWEGWNDGIIVDIQTRYLEFNRYYVDMIRAGMKQGVSTILCTHHLPHAALNGHTPSHYNFYSGVKNLVQELPFDFRFSNYLICGHTHRRVIGEVVPGFMGVNVGNDFGDFKYYVLEV